MERKHIFVSYSHKDKNEVKRELKRREKQGKLFWYDKSIEAGADWAETLGSKILEAEYVLYFESSYSKRSENCKRELNYAQEHGIPVVTYNLGSIAGKIIGNIVIAASLFVVAYVTFFKVVPPVVGFETQPAMEKLEEYGLKGSVQYDYSDAFPLGLVMKQSVEKKAFPYIPVTITQSLGPETSLTTAPDTVGSYVSDGVQMLVEAGLMRFSITASDLAGEQFGTITHQTAPAGYKISTQCSVGLSVATNGETLSFTCNGTEITIPAESGAVVEIDLVENTVTYPEVYHERAFENAVYIDAGTLKDPFIYNEVYDVPVVITGNTFDEVYFLNCTFYDDLVLKTDNEAVAVYIEGTCSVNGNLCIVNNIMQSDIETTLPKIFIEETMPVVVEHGSGTCMMIAQKDIIFNGERHTFDGTEYYAGVSSKKEDVVPIEQAPQQPSMFLVSQFYENGQRTVRQYASNIEVRRE